jgi:5-(carboxyamino)imidazole ribonucleotide synthase
MSKDITLGILYSGQLETQLVKSAKEIGGIKTVVLTDDKDGPAKHFCDEFICADLREEKAIDDFIKKIDLCTYAFENLSYKVLKSIANKKEVHPSPDTLRIAQNRILEKKLANDLGIKTTEWKSVKSLEELKEGVKSYGNCILKSVSGGYDGKQQYRFKTLEDIDKNIDLSKEYILEKFLKFKQEISVAATKYKDSKISIFEPTENQHAGGILRHSKIPANISKKYLMKLKPLQKILLKNLTMLEP